MNSGEDVLTTESLTAPITDRVAAADRHLRMVLLLGCLAAIIAFIDRSVINIVAEAIKHDLGFSDTQLGLLTGFAFSFFYSVMGLPIARLVDRPTTSRPTVIAVCIALWSAMTAISGAAQSYAQLVVARMLVAIGEAGSGPALLTLINHYSRPETRSRAFALYGLGVPFGTLLGLMLGGFLLDHVGWRMTFVIVGAPGILFALGLWLLLPEPRRSEGVAARTGAPPQPSVLENFRIIRRSPSLFWTTVAAALGGILVLGLPSWTGVYLIRVLHLSPTHAGLILGLTLGLAGGLGTFAGGWLADRLSRDDPGRALIVPGLGMLVGIPAALVAFLSDDWRLFTAFYTVTAFGVAAYLGPLFSSLQRLADESHRASTTSIVVIFANLIGAGLGPFIVGAISDLLSPSFGAHSLRTVLIGAYIVGLLPVWCYFRAAKCASRSLAGSLS